MGQVLEGKSGHPVDSDDEGRLFTVAATFPEEHLAAVEGNAFVLPIDAIDVNGSEHICVIKNTSALTLVVTSFTIRASETGRVVKVYLNETFTYAAGGTAVVPVNMKSGVAGGAVGDFYTIDAAGTDITTFAGTAVIGGIWMFNTTPMKIEKSSGWIIPPNQVWSLYNVTANDNVYNGYVSFYYHS